MNLRRYKRGYRKTVRQVHVSKAFVYTISILIGIILLIVMLVNKAIPVINTICENNAKAVALEVTNSSVLDNIQHVKYDNLVEIKKNEQGKIIAINADVMELNRLSTKISSDISDRLKKMGMREVEIPITTIFEMPLFSGFGPKIPFNVIPTGFVQCNFKSEFKEAGINQIRHRIYIEVCTKVRLVAPFRTSNQEYINEITIAETIIVGDIPSSYYNIQGVQGLDLKDSLNLIE